MKYCKNYCEEKEISTSELNEAQRTLYYIAENMKMDKSISEEGYRHFQKAIEALEQETTGYWIVGRIFPTKVGDENLIEYRCSECDRMIRCTESQLVNYPYCHCGARIESEKNE